MALIFRFNLVTWTAVVVETYKEHDVTALVVFIKFSVLRH